MKKENLYLKPFEFARRIGKYFMNVYYINLFCEKGNLKNILLKTRVRHIYKDVMGDEMWKERLSLKKKMENLRLLKEKAQEEYTQEVENFLPILFNQTLVMFCTVFDNFLIDGLDVITNLKPEMIKNLSTKEDRDILEAIEENMDVSRSTVFSIIRKKILERFDFKSIDKKINTFEALGLKRNIIFKLNKKMTVKYPKAEKLLKEIYSKRNDIVHKNTLPLRKFQELEHINGFFTHFIFKFSLDVWRTFNIKTDFHLMMSDQKNNSA